jgi:hypothetical protein
MARLALARAATRRGDRRAASVALRAARHAIRDRGLRVMHADLAETEAMLALDRGAWADAIVGAEELGRALNVVPMQLWAPLPSLIAGRALLGRGDVTEATPLLREAATSARRAGAAGTLALAAAVHDQSVLLSGRTPRRGDEANADTTSEIAAILAENAGITAWRDRDETAAIAAFDLAVDRWSDAGATVWLARAQRARATVLRATGDRARAAAADGRADAVTALIGMPPRERETIRHPLG